MPMRIGDDKRQGRKRSRRTFSLRAWCFCILLTLLALNVLAQTAEEYATQASRLAQDYRLRDAIQLLEKALEQYPDDPSLLLGLGTILIRSGQAARGEGFLQKALLRQPDNPDLLRSAGEAQLQQGKLATAVELFYKALRYRRDDGEAHHQLAYSLFLQGDQRKALEHAAAAVQASPLEARYRRFYAVVLDAEGRGEECYQQLRMAQRLAPRDPRILFQLSQNRKREGHTAQAIEYLELATDLDPENPLYHSEMAHLYAGIGEKEIAAQETQLAASLRLAFQTYLESLRLVGKKRDAEAARRLAPVVETHPEFVTGALLLADLYRKLGKDQDALKLYLKVLERDPHQATAREQGAWIQVQQGSLDAALKLLSTASRKSPNQALIEGHRELVQENWAGALKHFREAETHSPLDTRLLQLISFCLNAQGQREEALRYLEKAGKLDAQNPGIRRQALEIKLEDAGELVRARKWTRGLQAFEELIREDGPKADYLLNAAYCRQQLGELARAIEDYRAGLKLNPDPHWARVNLAASLYRTSRYEESAEEWERLLLREKRAENYFQVGLCYSRLERLPEAEYAFQKVLELGQKSPELLYNLGIVQLRQKNLESAWHLIRKAASSGYKPARQLLEQSKR